MSGYRDTILRDNPLSYWRLDESASAADRLARIVLADQMAANPGAAVGGNWQAEVLADSPTSLWKLGESSGTVAADVQGANPGTYQGVVTNQASYASLIQGTSGLVAYWKLDETSGTAMADYTGTNNGTYQLTVGGGHIASVGGAMPLSTDPGISWDALGGPNNLTQAPDNASFHFGTGDFTHEGWVKMASTSNLAWLTLLNGTPQIGIHFSGHVPQFILGSTTITSSGGAINDGKWHHIVAVRVGGVGYLYVDGVQVGTAAMSASASPAVPFILGWDTSGAGAGESLDDVSVYNVGLSAATVLQHYQAGAANIRQGVTGPLTNNTDTAVQLDGAFGYASFPHASALCPSTPGSFTVEGWVKLTSLPSSFGPVYSTFDGSHGIDFYINPGGNLTTGGAGGGGSSGTIGTGAWHHVAWVCSGTTLTFYIDGAASGTTTLNTNAAGTLTEAIGISPTLPARAFPGDIFGVAVYPSALSAQRILTHYTAGTQTALTFGAVGALTGSGDNDAAVTLDGQTGLVDAGDSTGLRLTAPFSLEMPVKPASRTPAIRGSSSGTGATVTAPAGLTDGDLIFVLAPLPLAADLAGFTNLFVRTDGVFANYALWYKVASSEPASWTLTGAGSASADWAVQVWKNASTTSPINVSAYAKDVTTSPTVTTTVAGCGIATFGIADNSAAGAITVDAACTIDAHYDSSPASAQGALVAAHDTVDQAAAGVTTGRSITNGGANGMLVATVAIAPAPSVGVLMAKGIGDPAGDYEWRVNSSGKQEFYLGGLLKATSNTALTAGSYNFPGVTYDGGHWLDTVLADNPTSLWKLAESSGTVAVDVQGANPGTYQNVYPVSNPGFESGTSPWSAAGDGIFTVAGGTLTQVSTSPHSGTYCGQVTAPSSQNGIEQSGVTPPGGGSWQSGTSYSFTWWLKGNAGGESVRIGLGSGASFVTSSVVTLTTSWAPYTLTFTPGSTYASLIAVCRAEANSLTWFVDDVGQGAILGQPGPLINNTDTGSLFDGASGYVSAGDPASLRWSGSGGYALEAWVYQTSASGFQVIIGKYNNSAGHGISIYANGGALGYSVGGTRFDGAGGALTLNTWTHLGITFDGTNGRFYVNGVLKSTNAASLAADTGGLTFYIGQDSQGGGFRFTGRIFGAAAYGAALSTARLLAHYNATQTYVRFYLNGSSDGATLCDALTPTSTGHFTIGARSDGSGALNATIDEAVVYNTALTPQRWEAHYAAATAGAFASDTTSTSEAVTMLMTSFIATSQTVTTAEALGLVLIGLASVTDSPTHTEVIGIQGSPNALTEQPTIEGEYVILNGRAWTMNEPAQWYFLWGEHPNAYSETTVPQDFTSPVLEVSMPIGAVAPGTTYHCALVVTSPLGTVTGGDVAFTIPLTVPVPDLLDDLPPYEQGSYDIQGAVRALATELARVEASRQDVIQNFFPATADALLRYFEMQFGLPPEPPQLTLAQRQQVVLSFFKALTSQGTGLEWEQAITRLMGTNWTYREHNPSDITSPPAYTILVNIPFSPPAAVPAGLTATPASGGSLAVGTYYYAVTTTTTFGQTLACTAVSATTNSSNKKVNLAWTASSPPITGYNVFRGTSPSALFLLASVATNSYTDDGSAVLSGQPPPTHDTSASQLGNVAQQFIRQVTPAHLALEFGYEGGFLVELSEIGVSAL